MSGNLGWKYCLTNFFEGEEVAAVTSSFLFVLLLFLPALPSFSSFFLPSFPSFPVTTSVPRGVLCLPSTLQPCFNTRLRQAAEIPPWDIDIAQHIMLPP